MMNKRDIPSSPVQLRNSGTLLRALVLPYGWMERILMISQDLPHEVLQLCDYYADKT